MKILQLLAFVWIIGLVTQAQTKEEFEKSIDAKAREIVSTLTLEDKMMLLMRLLTSPLLHGKCPDTM